MLYRALSLHIFNFTIKVILPYLSFCVQFHIPHLIFCQILSLTCASWTHHHFSWWAGRFMSDVVPSLFVSLSSDSDYHASLGHQWIISLYLPELEWPWFWTTKFCWFQDTFNMLVHLQVSPPLLCFDLPWQDADFWLSVEIPVLTSNYFNEV